jgi:hypothetical protein
LLSAKALQREWKWVQRHPGVAIEAIEGDSKTEE